MWGVVIRRSLLLFGVILLIAILFGGYQLWQNNKVVRYPQKLKIDTSLKKGIEWLDNHRTEILNEENPMLWWMVKESAQLTGDSTLNSLYTQYRTKYLDTSPNATWSHLFYAHSAAPLNTWQLEGIPNYNLFFLYGLSCNADLAESTIIKEQLRPEFCDAHLFSPACVTHQLMGFRFMQRRDCGNSEQVRNAIDILQRKIVTQLTWDPRVVDVYLQRALMLEDSGASEQIKPIWIARILSAQDSYGGWSGFQPLIPLGKGIAAGFSARGVSVAQRQADFHATAQGVLLMSLLLSHSK